MMNYEEGITEWCSYRVLTNEINEHYSGKCKQAAMRLKSLANMNINEIKSSDIMKSIQDISRTYHPESIRKSLTYAKLAFDYLIAMDYIKSNPFNSVKKPKRPNVNRKSLTKEQASNLYNSMVVIFNETGDKRAAGIAIMLSTGIRVGELLALEGGEVLNGVLSIDKALKDDRKTVGVPKTKSSIRRIAVNEKTEQLLNDACPFVGMTHSKIGHWFRKWADSNGYEGLVIHELRHTHATLLISEGVDIKTVQTRLGHSSAMTTLDIYSHAVYDNGIAAAEKIGEILA